MDGRVAALLLAAGLVNTASADAVDPSEGWVAALLGRTRFGLEADFAPSLQTRNGWPQTAQLSLVPDVEVELPGKFRLRGSARLRGDPFDRFEPGQPSQAAVSVLSRRAFLGDHVELELRELTIEGPLGSAYVVVGKQAVVWGKSDGLKLLDVVNPQYFREFILEDFEDSRIPLWTVNAEFPVRRATLQLLWIPDPSFHVLPEPGAIFAITSTRFLPPLPPGVLVVVEEPRRPKHLFLDSDAGVRLSGFWRGWDLTLNYLYHYSDLVIPFRSAPSAPGEPVVVSPSWRRTHLAGGTASRAFGDFVLRAESGWSTSRYFSTADPNQADGVVRSGEFGYVLGLDWYGLRDTLISAQLFQSWLPGYRAGLGRDELDTSVSLLVRRTLLRETLTVDASWIHNVNDRDVLVRAKIRYELTDRLALELGLDLFYGPRQGVFGQYRDRSRAAAGISLAL